MESEIEKPEPPREADILFRNDLPDWHNNACLNVMLNGDELGYTEGYRRGGRLLVEYVNEKGRDQDYLVYPVFFLYRHHIELALKNLIVRSPFLMDRTLTDSESKHLGTHRIDLLWQDLKPMLATICDAAGWGELDRADVFGIDSYIRQLAELDPDSFRFRYTKSKGGDPSLPEHLKGFNLRNFAEMMERLANYLEGLDFATSHLEDTKAEMEAEWRNEMAQYQDF